MKTAAAALSIACLLAAGPFRAPLQTPLWADIADKPYYAPEGPIVTDPEAPGETVVLSALATRVRLAGRVRIHVEGPQGLPSSAFESVPNRRLFSRLPAGDSGGIGTALAAAPFSSADVWMALSILNTTEDPDWALVADGAGFRPAAMVVVADDGSRSEYGGHALERLRWDAGIADATAYLIRLSPNERTTVYLRLSGDVSFGPELRLWRTSVLLGQVGSVSALSGVLLGLTALACVASALAVSRHRFSREGPLARGGPASTALRLAYPALALCSIALGYRGGGQSALLAGIGLGRYAASVAIGAAALAVEAVSASLAPPGPNRPAGRIRGHLAPRLAFAAAVIAAALSAYSPLTSFVLPVGLLLQVLVLCAIEAAAYGREARAESVEVARLSSRLDAEIRGGADFMTATAAALRGPLFGLVGILEDLDAVVSDLPSMPKQAASDLALARAEAARLDNLVSNILSYSGVGIQRLTVEDLDLSSLARAAAGLLRVAVAGRGIRVEVDAPIIEMRNDIGLVHRLLYTAMNRAARADGATRVVLAASSDDTGVHVSVDGDGADHQPADRKREPGPDMDLTVLTRLASLLGGSFSCRRVGDGTSLSFRLPRYVEPAAAARVDGDGRRSAARFPARSLVDEAEFRAGDAARTPAGRILVVGNEPVALLAIKRRLESSSWGVELTVSARDALSRIIGGDRFDIVIIDSVMPEMSGFSFCESVRGSSGPESIPIILLVESGRPDEIERAFRCGANDYIVRPASGMELEARVKTHVDLASSVRRELEQAARMAEFDKYRTLALLSAGVAHEINTPNNAVLRNVPILKEIWSSLDVVVERMHREEGGFSVRGFGYDDLKRDIPDMLNDLYMGAQDIKKIVEGLKDYAGAPSGSAVPGLVDANESVRYAARLLKHSIAVSTERFELALPDGLPRVRADRLKLTQVVVNVLENALQALPDRSRGVRIETSALGRDGPSPSVVVRVVDEGIGMTPETLASVFHPFFTTKRDRGGSGLGLAVASGIVHDMAGTIELRSTPGQGTEATICIPAAGGPARSDDGR